MLAGCWVVPARAASDISLLDVIELDAGYTTIADQYYRRVSPQQLLDGARTGIVAYLRGQGIADPQVPVLHARPDGRGVVPAIESELGRAIERYDRRVDVRELVYNTIRGELGALGDPYSVFFSKAELSGFTAALDGSSFGGIGIVLAADAAGHFVIDQVFDDSPSARAGLVAGDRVVSVDGKPVDGLAPQVITGLLRGRIGTVVRLELLRGDESRRLAFAIDRAAITPPEVTARLLAGQVGYLALRTFGPRAGEDVHAALTKLRAQGARAIVFDLRGNGGGYERSAEQVASAFIPSGPIVLTQTNHGHKLVSLADGSAPAPLPLVVLVDGDSASGSELVTGAIADHRLGKVVGTRTFGKGLVQTMFPLPDGSALKVTTARYFTPSGRDINRVGIAPDVTVPEPAAAQRGLPGHDPQLDAALALLAAPAPASEVPATQSPPSAKHR